MERKPITLGGKHGATLRINLPSGYVDIETGRFAANGNRATRVNVVAHGERTGDTSWWINGDVGDISRSVVVVGEVTPMNNQLPAGDLFCDFCHAPNPEKMWLYPHTSFLVWFRGRPLLVPESKMATCETCGRLINAGDIQGLIERMCIAQSGEPELSEYDRRRLMTGMAKGFAVSRVGPPAPYLKS